MPLLILLIPFAAAVGQSPASPSIPAPPTGGPHHFTRTFISPMGEPFRAETRGEDVLAEWFRQADRNHDGQITVDEMQADGDRFFAILDTNHDGEIDPDEMTHYEDVVAPEIRSGAAADFAMMDRASDAGGRGGHGGRGGGHHHGGGGGGGASSGWAGRGVQQGLEGASRFGLLDLPEPVASADTNFNRGISLEEFREAARERFGALDVDHQGRLTLAVLETVVPPPPAEPHKSNDSVDSVPVDPGG